MYNELARRAFPGSPIAYARFRKEILAPLRSRLDMVESRMSAHEFSTIKYEAVPSKAMAKWVRVAVCSALLASCIGYQM